MVLNLTFPDFDLDYDDLGGTLAWQTPSDATQAHGNTRGVEGVRCGIRAGSRKCLLGVF